MNVQNTIRPEKSHIHSLEQLKVIDNRLCRLDNYCERKQQKFVNGIKQSTGFPHDFACEKL